jgi:DNA-binding transcriptional MerR regulator
MNHITRAEQNTLAAHSYAESAVRYPIGVAARLTGIQVETLRVWERRYNVIGPQVSATGRRLYSGADLERLRLIKQLVDAGHPIGSVATVPTAKLLELREAVAGAAGHAAAEPVTALGLRAVLVGEAQRAGRGRGLTVTGSAPDIERAIEQLRNVSADLVIVEMASLLDLDLEELGMLKSTVGARLAVVLYRFGASSTVRRIRKAGHVVAHAALDEFGLNTLCKAALLPAGAQPPAQRHERRLDNASLEALAHASSSIECECPKHLVDLVRSLTSFEAYSEQCSVRSVADALLHQDLQQTAARARSMLEQALIRLAMLEGLPLPGAR